MRGEWNLRDQETEDWSSFFKKKIEDLKTGYSEKIDLTKEDLCLENVIDILNLLGYEDYDTDTRFEGKSATFIGIWPLPNANSLDVIKDIRKLLPEIERILPGSIKFKVNYDATDYIRNAIHEVIDTLKETIVLVMIVIFLFIGSFIISLDISVFSISTSF